MELKLVQKKGGKWDKLWIENGVLFHEWDLGREKGSKQTSLENIDPNLGLVKKKTDGQWILFSMTMVFIFLFALYAAPPSSIGIVGWAYLFLSIACFVGGMYWKQSKRIDMIYRSDGGLFAVVRRDWVDEATRNTFFKEAGWKPAKDISEVKQD